MNKGAHLKWSLPFGYKATGVPVDKEREEAFEYEDEDVLIVMPLNNICIRKFLNPFVIFYNVIYDDNPISNYYRRKSLCVNACMFVSPSR